MHVEYHKWWSPSLGQNMELKVYGHAGRPIVVFPAQGGRFFDYEDFGMIEACAASIEAGRVQFIAVDSIDNQSWCNWHAHPAERARRHNDYDRYIVEEVRGFLGDRGHTGRFLTTGCSMGGYHAGNFFFRHPDVFDGTIVLSGLFQLRHFLGDYMDEGVYHNAPLAYLPNLSDLWYLDLYRRSDIIVCAGRGAWDEEMLTDALALRDVLAAKGVPCWIDIWGHDVNHDWPWWRRQMPYFLHHLGL